MNPETKIKLIYSFNKALELCNMSLSLCKSNNDRIVFIRLKLAYIHILNELRKDDPDLDFISNVLHFANKDINNAMINDTHDLIDNLNITNNKQDMEKGSFDLAYNFIKNNKLYVN